MDKSKVYVVLGWERTYDEMGPDPQLWNLFVGDSYEAAEEFVKETGDASSLYQIHRVEIGKPFAL